MRRAREWTRALSDWWALQPDMVAFTGRCLVHRAEIMQLDGAWPDALDEARRAGERFVETRNPAAGLARYRQGELLRLQGDFAGAERAYREASTFGWEPQPGLAQLRLAQGRTDAAVSAIRRAEAATTDPLERAALLPAFVEIALAAGDVDAARRACAELEEISSGYESAMLDAIVAHARGRCTSPTPSRARRSPRCGRRSRRGMPSTPRTRSHGRAPSSATRVACSATRRPPSWSTTRRRSIFERLGATPDLARFEAPSKRTRALAARARGASARRRRQDEPRDRGVARHQRAHRRATRPEHLREARPLLPRRRDGVRVRARPRLTRRARGQK